jgi:hypothetical protein
MWLQMMLMMMQMQRVSNSTELPKLELVQSSTPEPMIVRFPAEGWRCVCDSSEVLCIEERN